MILIASRVGFRDGGHIVVGLLLCALVLAASSGGAPQQALRALTPEFENLAIEWFSLLHWSRPFSKNLRPAKSLT
jgi:hypothetical protein